MHQVQQVTNLEKVEVITYQRLLEEAQKIIPLVQKVAQENNI